LRCASALETHLDAHHRDTAALIVEPLVQCAAGMAMYHPEYLRRAKALCERYEVHLIADEIAVGLRPHRKLSRLRAGLGPAGLPVPLEGPERRLPALVGGAHDGAGLPGVLRRRRGARFFALPLLQRQSARLPGALATLAIFEETA